MEEGRFCTCPSRQIAPTFGWAICVLLMAPRPNPPSCHVVRLGGRPRTWKHLFVRSPRPAHTQSVRIYGLSFHSNQWGEFWWDDKSQLQNPRCRPSTFQSRLFLFENRKLTAPATSVGQGEAFCGMVPRSDVTFSFAVGLSDSV